MSLDITIKERKEFRCPGCGRLVTTQDIDAECSSGRVWYDFLFRDGKITIDHHEENGWFAYDFNGKRATHWMPIPKPPKGE